jgi:hypothetical protein
LAVADLLNKFLDCFQLCFPGFALNLELSAHV